MERCLIWAIAALLIAQSAAVINDNGTNVASSNMRVKVTKYGLDYASEVAADIVNNELLSLNVPPLEQDFSGGSVSADSIRVTSLLPPTYSYRLTEPNTVVWSIDGGRLTVEGRYKGSVKALFVPVSGSGSFKASVNGLQLTVRILLNVEQARPKVRVIECQSNMNDVHLEISGGIVGWLMNRLEEQIASQLPPKLQAVVCERVTGFVENDVNNKLQTIPITVKLDSFTLLDYGLIAPPTVSSDSLELRHKGTFTSVDGDAQVAQSTPIESETFEQSHYNESLGNNTKMLQITISERMFNSYLNLSFHSGFRSLVVDKATNAERAKFLEAQCGEREVCIGNYLPDYRQAYGNAAMSAILELAEPAKVEIVEGGGRCKANGAISVLADGRAILNVNVSAEVALTVKVVSEKEGTVLKGLLSFTSLVVSSAGQSDITSLNDPFAMDTFVELAKLVFEAQMNEILDSGAPIPLPHGTKLSNAETMFIDKYLLLLCDLEYISL